uniref:Uncharacterized protein n=1 Tax=Chelonoidis abingdonii TaxID=106734 RepID=A0A8C0INQ5_CHEAB
MVSSVVGFYSSPLFTRLLPARQDTPMTKIIGNCVSLLVLSSALPVFSRTLGLHKLPLPDESGASHGLGHGGCCGPSNHGPGGKPQPRLNGVI